MTPPEPWPTIMGRLYRALFPIPPQQVDEMLLWQAGTLIHRPEPQALADIEDRDVPNPQPTPEEMAGRVRRWAESHDDMELIARLDAQGL